MSQLILDEQLNHDRAGKPLLSWITAKRLEDLHPGEVIKDARIPQLLCEPKQPTFVTIDEGFWNRNLRHPKYCLLYFALRDDQQGQLPNLLRRLFRLKEFKTKSARMGKVVKVSSTSVEYRRWGDSEKDVLSLPLESRRRQSSNF